MRSADRRFSAVNRDGPMDAAGRRVVTVLEQVLNVLDDQVDCHYNQRTTPAQTNRSGIPQTTRDIYTTEISKYIMWLSSLLARAIDSQLDCCKFKFDSWPPWLVLGSVTIFRWANHLSISLSHPGRLSLLPSVGREMSTSQTALQ